MKIAPRGKFKTLVHDDGAPVTFRGIAVVAKAPRLVQGKTYATLAIEDDDGDVIGTVDREIRNAVVAGIEYSPLLHGKKRLVVVKVGANALMFSCY